MKKGLSRWIVRWRIDSHRALLFHQVALTRFLQHHYYPSRSSWNLSEINAVNLRFQPITWSLKIGVSLIAVGFSLSVYLIPLLSNGTPAGVACYVIPVHASHFLICAPLSFLVKDVFVQLNSVFCNVFLQYQLSEVKYVQLPTTFCS